jgi:NAD(P)-dependent dehydrogenase (short-subunit alcohol dehydrogenase family)
MRRILRRVCDAFVPLLPSRGGRIVDVTSASGPSFVARCSEERQRFFCDPAITWEQLSTFLRSCVVHVEDGSWAAAQGLGEGGAYGLSKAAANSLTLILAREHPEHRVNACTPGFIETDMTRHDAASQGKPPSELGMKPPEAGTVAPMHLLFGEVEGTGRYYGSDARRSPLDRYREPGTPAYEGD